MAEHELNKLKEHQHWYKQQKIIASSCFGLMELDINILYSCKIGAIEELATKMNARPLDKKSLT